MKKEIRSNSLDLTQGSIIRGILLFSGPLIVGNIFQQLYNTVDSVIAGNYIGKPALAAIGSSNSLINLIIGLFMGIATLGFFSWDLCLILFTIWGQVSCGG